METTQIAINVSTLKKINGRSRERSNEAWHCVIYMVIWVCNDFFKLLHLFLVISLFD